MLDGSKSQVRRSATRSVSPSFTKQSAPALWDAQQAELVRRHRHGAFKKQLAPAYGVHVPTVRAIIRRHVQSASE